MKTGTRVINKVTREELTLDFSKTLLNQKVIYYFKKKDGGVEICLEPRIERMYYLRIHAHPTVIDIERKKTVKKRTVQIFQPTSQRENERSIYDYIV